MRDYVTTLGDGLFTGEDWWGDEGFAHVRFEGGVVAGARFHGQAPHPVTTYELLCWRFYRWMNRSLP